MSTRLPFPHIFPGSDSNWDKVAKEIAFITTALKHIRDGDIQPMPKDDSLKIFQHISTLVTTGEFGGPRKDDTAAIVNAVSGQVEAHRISSIVFTRNTRSTNGYGGGGYKKIEPTVGNRGKELLEKWRDMQHIVLFDQHLQDVVDILHYILENQQQVDISRMMLFVHCRALPKLSARTQKAILLWGQAPFRIVAEHYKGKAQSGRPVTVTGASFSLSTTPDTRDDLARLFELDVSTQKSNEYHVTPENVGKWADVIASTYDIIERIVLTPGATATAGLKRRSFPLSSPEEAITLVQAIDKFGMFLNSKPLIKAIFSDEGLEGTLVGQYVTAKTKGMFAGDANGASGSVDIDGLEEEEDASDQSEPSESAGGGAQIVRFCRTITAWSEAVEVIAKASTRFPKPVALDVYHVNALPRKHDLSQDDVDAFKTRYVAHLEKTQHDDKIRKKVNLFLDSRLGNGCQMKAQQAMVHAEAAAMGLVGILVFGGEPFGTFTKARVAKLFPVSGKVVIAVSKKCCRCCAMLASLLNKRNTNNVSFMLPGTHATFFPWSPPRGVPLSVLKEMRNELYAIFNRQAFAFEPGPSSTMSSPAASDGELPQHSFVDV